jgi:FkbM family methyltransferase
MDESTTQQVGLNELKLRLLHDLIGDAATFSDFLVPYMRFLRSLRERAHPVGSDDLRIVELKSGLRFKINLGDRLGCDFYYGYYQEQFDSLLWLSLIEAGDIVFDIGANFGYYAISASAAMGDKGFVYAFEPNREVYELLRENITLNDFENSIKCYLNCIGNADGMTDFFVTEESSFSGMGATGRSNLVAQIDVPIARLDTFVKEHNIPHVSALKIDVEGYEFAVLEGAIDTIKSNDDLVIMMEISAKNLDDNRLQNLNIALSKVYELGFRIWYLSPSSLELKSIENLSEIFSATSGNVFLLKPDSKAFVKLQESFKDLRLKAFENLATEWAVSPDLFSRRNAYDSFSSENILSAIIGKITKALENNLSHCHASLKDQVLKIRSRDDQLRQCHTSLEEKTLQICSQDEKLKQCHTSLAEKTIQIQQGEEKLNQCHVSLGEKALQIRDGEEKLKQCHVTLEEQALKIRTRNEQLQQCHATLKEQTLQLRDDEEKLKQYHVTLEKQALQIRDNEEKLKQCHVTLEEQALKIQTRNEQLRQCNATLKEQTLQIHDGEEKLKQCHVTLEEQALQIADLQEKLALSEQSLGKKLVRSLFKRPNPR